MREVPAYTASETLVKRPTGLLLALLSMGGLARGQEIVEFANPTAGAESLAIAAGPDGNMWFTEVTYDETGRFIIDTRSSGSARRGS